MTFVADGHQQEVRRHDSKSLLGMTSFYHVHLVLKTFLFVL